MSQVLATPAPTPTRRQRLVAPAWTIGGLAVATLALRLRDPHEHGSWGICPSAAMGVWCPGCGGLRAVNDLSHGHPLDAASSNLAFVVALPFILLGLTVWVVNRWRGTRLDVSPRVVKAFTVGALTALAVFTVLRNLPAGAWLAP
ncbi:DUF2752 domain-containing protein [Nocardioides sp.]|jgi:hypothetical protein|uniref:DUF2752 domain-containing protein n=1 Tax=Nocardioides sp. TaxID=35761 RepID=UPI0031FF3D65